MKQKLWIALALALPAVATLRLPAATVPGSTVGTLSSAAAVPPPGVFRKRPVRLPPLLWYENDPEESRRLLMLGLLYWDLQERESSQRMLLPFVYRWQEANRHLLLALPLIAAYGSPDEHWSLAGPWYRYRGQDGDRSWLFPVWWQSAYPDGDRYRTILPLLFYEYRNDAQRRLDRLSLFGWRHRTEEANSGWSLNTFWSGDEHSGWHVFFPLYAAWWSPGDKLRVLIPFYDRRFGPPVSAAGEHRIGLFPLAGVSWSAGKLQSHHLIPLYYYSGDEKESTFVSLPVSHFRDGEERQGHVLLYYYDRYSNGASQGLFPLWYGASGPEGRRMLLANYYYRRSPAEGTFHTLFPLYGYWSSAAHQRTFLTWGLWRRASEQESTGWLFLYHWKQTRTKGVAPENRRQTRVFLPLYWHFFSGKPLHRTDLLFPLFLQNQDDQSTLTIVPPLVYKHGPDRNLWSVCLLFWKDRGQNAGFQTFLPFYYSSYKGDDRRFISLLGGWHQTSSMRETLIPPYYSFVQGATLRRVLFPLYWQFKDAKDQSLILIPYYRHQWDRGWSEGVFPFWRRAVDGDEHSSMILPFYTSQRSNLVSAWSVPLLLTWMTKTKLDLPQPDYNLQYALLGSVSRRGESREHAFFPLYKYKEDSDGWIFWAPRVLPLTAWKRSGESRLGYFFPVAWSRSPDKDWNVLFPLWYRARRFSLELSGGANESSRTETGRTHVIFPLYWHIKDLEREQLWVIPLAGAFRNGDRRSYFVTPFWFGTERPGGRSQALFPLYWRSTNAEGDFRFIFPLYATSRQADSRWSMFAPLWFAYDRPSGQRFHVLFPLYWRVASADRDIAVALMGYRVRSSRNGRQTETTGLAPFFSRSYTDANNRYFDILGGLFGRDIQDGRRSFRYLYFFYTAPR